MKIEFTLNEAFYIAKILSIQVDEKRKFLLSLGSEVAPFDEITKLNLDLKETTALFEKMIEAMNDRINKENTTYSEDNDND